MSIEAEQAVLGGLMLLGADSEQAGAAMSVLTPASFSVVDHQIIFAAIVALAERGDSCDPLTVTEYAKRDKRWRKEIGELVMELAINTPTAANLRSYAEIVRESAIKRFAVSKMQEALAVITDEFKGDIYKRLGLAESIITSIQNRAMRNRTAGLRHVKDVGREWLAEVESRMEGKQRGFTLGIKALDELLAPKRVPAGSLVVVGARPKQGKSAVLGRIATHFAIERGEAVAVFSLEMPERQIYERLMVGSAGVDPGIFYRAPDSADPWHSVNRAAAQFNESQLHIDDTPGVRLSHVQREARALNRKHKVGLVAVDYLTLMEAESADRNDLGYARITKGLKNLAKELDCVVLLLTQLNRKLEDRPNKRPLPSDSRDTGQIEQDCDLWIGLYRDASYHDGAPPGLTEAIVRLNRHGGTGTAYFDLVNGAVAEVDQDWARSASDQAPQKVTRLRV